MPCLRMPWIQRNQEFAFNKNSLEMGWASSKVTVAYENMGNAPNLYPIPADGIFQPAAESCFTGSGVGVYCWYQVIPAQTPDPSQYDNNNGGTGFMMGTGDFLSFFSNSGLGDNRTATFYWTGLSSLNTPACSACPNIKFGGSIINTPVVYMNEGINCLAQFGGSCGLGVQKSGPIPLGDMCGAQGLSTSLSCPESGIQTNGDGVTQVSYSDGQALGRCEYPDNTDIWKILREPYGCGLLGYQYRCGTIIHHQ